MKKCSAGVSRCVQYIIQLVNLILALLLISGCSYKTDDIIKLTLDNGLRAVIVRNNLAPAVSIQMTYLAGSNDSPPGFPGTAHAVEHMMFRGSPGLSGEQLAAINAAMGGMFNAETDEMETRYFSTVPAKNLETALHVEALRMAGLNIDEKAWNIERGALEQEVLQNLSEPAYHLFSRVNAQLFKDTPYEHDALGSTASFDKTSGAMLKKFYNDWYAPNNAVLVITGNLDPKSAAETVRKHFSSIPSRPIPQHPIVSPSQLSPAHFELDSNYSTGFSVMAFRLPGADSPDYPALQLLADILDSHSGKLTELTMNGTTLGTSFDLYVAPHVSAAYVSAAFAPGEDGHQLLKALKETISGYTRNGVPADRVAAAKYKVKLSSEFLKTSIEDQASDWSDTLVLHKALSPTILRETIGKVTVEDVNRVAKKYLNCDQAITVVMTPKESGTPTRMSNARRVRDSFTPEGITTVKLPLWASNLAKADVPTRTGDKPVDVRLKNGLRIIVKPDNGGKAIAVYGYVKNNPDLETLDGKEGVAEIMEMLFDYGTARMSWQEYIAAQDKIGAVIDLGSGFSLGLTNENFDRGVALLADGILNPSFSAEAFTIIQKKANTLTRNVFRSPGHLAQQAMLEALHEKNSPILRQASPETLAALSLADVKEYYKTVFRPDVTTIVVIGAISSKEAVASIEKHFGGWQAIGPVPETDFKPGKPNGKATIVVPDKQRTQDEVTLKEILTLTRSSPDYYPLQVGLAVLSGGFYATRLSNELREKRGLVYSVNATLASDKEYSEFEISFGTSAKYVLKARNIIERILMNMATVAVPQAELDQARNILLNQMMLSRTSYEGIVGELLECSVMGLPLDEPETAAMTYNRITPHQVQSAFGKWIRPKDLVQVTQGAH